MVVRADATKGSACMGYWYVASTPGCYLSGEACSEERSGGESRHFLPFYRDTVNILGWRSPSPIGNQLAFVNSSIIFIPCASFSVSAS